ncbi:MAG: Transcriptional regulator [uncultured Campylobacterales bacterium]|uniref:Transcriptional regulator n=1 Tax=uncultured Campylobacterales bacterium TaxID=352960 RepID=A0A6S6SQH7_9BACT|nr:MAG: Transcriptional regulator [uncultured Campylobacterales bacterium]
MKEIDPKENTPEYLEQYAEQIKDIVSANIKRCREAKGVSQMDLALGIGLTGGAYLGRAELRKENHHFNLSHIAKISKVLDVSIAKFFEAID